MKNSEIIKKNIAVIKETMIERYKKVLESEGRIQYKIYIWEDGEIECLMDAQGSTSYLKPKDWESRELIYICTITEPCVNIYDLSGESPVETESEQEQQKAEIIEWLVSEYSETADEIIANAISQYAESEEEE